MDIASFQIFSIAINSGASGSVRLPLRVLVGQKRGFHAVGLIGIAGPTQAAPDVQLTGVELDIGPLQCIDFLSLRPVAAAVAT